MIFKINYFYLTILFFSFWGSGYHSENLSILLPVSVDRNLNTMSRLGSDATSYFLSYANGRDVPVLKFHGSFVHTIHINPLYCLVCGHFGMFLTFVLCCQPLGRVAAVIFALYSPWLKKKTTLRDRSLENIWLWEWM